MRKRSRPSGNSASDDGKQEEDEVRAVAGEELDGNGPSLEEAAPEVGVEHPPDADEPEVAIMTHEELAAELERSQQEAREYLDGWQRARAEFANYKKRVERDLSRSYDLARGDVLSRTFAILDDLDMALADRPREGNNASWADGIELIRRKLEALLEAEGVEPFVAEGEQFDPNLHEAITHEPNSECKEGEIIAVIRRGYKMGDRVLRPAQVRVAK